jgi:hypothetical protein
MAANAEQIDESLKRQALAEEEAAMNQYKKSTNPFLSSPTSATAPPVAAAGKKCCCSYIAQLSMYSFGRFGFSGGSTITTTSAHSRFVW